MFGVFACLVFSLLRERHFRDGPVGPRCSLSPNIVGDLSGLWDSVASLRSGAPGQECDGHWSLLDHVSSRLSGDDTGATYHGRQLRLDMDRAGGEKGEALVFFLSNYTWAWRVEKRISLPDDPYTLLWGFDVVKHRTTRDASGRLVSPCITCARTSSCVFFFSAWN